MAETGAGMQAVLDRLTRIEAGSEHRDDRLMRIETTLAKQDALLQVMAGDLRDARTGLRVGLWVFSTMTALATGAAAVIGWFVRSIVGK